MTKNTLYYGDNLYILRQYIKDESVDLIYLDPPFKSNQNYNILFREHSGTDSTAQIKAFEDTWQWDQGAALEYKKVVEAGGKISETMQALRIILGTNDMLAYLTMMAPRLVELQRVLKPTGSIYLHCDPTASHYLKLLIDSVFGSENFINEIIWKRTFAHNSANKYGCVHDIILFYSKTDNFTWNKTYQPYDEQYINTFFDQTDKDGYKYMRMDLTGAGISKGESGKTWRGIDVTAKGRHWAYSVDTLELLDKQGKIHWPSKKGGMPRLKRYPEDTPGVAIQDIWTDIRPIHNLGTERLGYPTQKPTALLKRIIMASSNKGDVVLDPFCGCGTTINAAQELERAWIGIDITCLATSLIKHRIKSAYGDKVEYDSIGEPVSLTDAKALALEDRYQFQWWALGLVGARPVEQKKGAGRGIDGKIFFHDNAGKTGQIILSVKSGHITIADIRDLRGVIEREKADIGVFITLEKPTRSMHEEATGAGFYKSREVAGAIKHHPRIQILTIEEVLSGKQISCPPLGLFGTTFKTGQKANV